MTLAQLRLVRRLHLWMGAWGAIAAILFGFSGFVQNHRGVLKLPQGDSTEIGKLELSVPDAARRSPADLRAWLRDVQHLPIDSQRVQPGKPVIFNGERILQPAHWNFSGGNARISLQAEYSAGAESISVRTTSQSALAVLGRLHKGVGGGLAWILLSDSFALAMIALGISGLLLWARGRSPRQLVVSIVGAAVLLLMIVVGGAVV